MEIHNLRYHDLRTNDTLNGPGFRVTLFVSGCNHRCQECHNPETWDINGGKEFTKNELDIIIHELNRPEISGLTISGGDPFHPLNFNNTIKICGYIKNELNIQKNIWVYTGYVWEKLTTNAKNNIFMNGIDVVVDGPYIKELRNTKIPFAGSKNQRMIDVKKSTEAHVVIWSR